MYSKVSDKSLPSLTYLDSMFLDYRELRIKLRTLGISGLTKAQGDEAVKDAIKAIRDYENEADLYVKTISSEEERSLFKKVQEEWGSFKSIGELVLKYHSSNKEEDRSKMIAIFLSDCPQAAGRFTLAIEKLKEYHSAESNKFVKEARISGRDSVQHMGTLSLVGVIIGLSLGLSLVSSINRNILTAIETLNNNSAEVRLATQQISESSESLAQSTNEQASSLQQTAVSLEEIGAMISKTSLNANAAEVDCRDTQAKAEDGRRAMSDMLSSMGKITENNKDIADQITLSNNKFLEIIQVIHAIGEKTKVINDIVFQTRLLSFNASVEAARAGDNGKGFAVVAEEVGNLAIVSGKAAQEISIMLAESTAKVNEAISEIKSKSEKIIEQGNVRVNSGMEVAERCFKILEEVIQSVNHISELANEIASAAREQSKGVDEINESMKQLDITTHSNASVSSEANAAVNRLSSQANVMSEAVEKLDKMVNGLVKAG